MGLCEWLSPPVRHACSKRMIFNSCSSFLLLLFTSSQRSFDIWEEDGGGRKYGNTMTRTTSNPVPALKAIRSLTTATSTYKPFLGHQPSVERSATKPKRKILEAIAIPYLHSKGANDSSFSKYFQLRFRKVHAYSMTATATKDFESNFGEDRFSRRWHERTDSLWWSVIAFKAFAAKRVVRSHGARKLRVAFVESLKKAGVAPDGSWLEPQAQQNKDPVMGTAHMSPTVEILNGPMEDLVLETDRVVDLILRWQKRNDVEPRYAKKFEGIKAGKYGAKRVYPSKEMYSARQGSSSQAGAAIRINR